MQRLLWPMPSHCKFCVFLLTHNVFFACDERHRGVDIVFFMRGNRICTPDIIIVLGFDVQKACGLCGNYAMAYFEKESVLGTTSIQ